MIFVSKLFTALILPPGCIIIGLIIMILTLPRKSKWKPIPLIVVIYAISIQPVSDFLLLPLENAYPPVAENEAVKNNELKDIQAVVVLGAGSIMLSPEAEGHDSLSSDAFKRAVYGFELSNTHKLPVIFSGGKVFDYGQESEAETAERLHQSLGFKEKFTAESESRNTWENSVKVARMEIKNVILVTSAYHMKRAMYCFEKNRVNVIPAPTDYKCDRGRKYGFLSFLPSISSLSGCYTALHEYIGFFIYNIIYRCPA